MDIEEEWKPITIEGFEDKYEQIGQYLPEFTLVGSPLMDGKEERPLKSQDWPKLGNDNCIILYKFS